MGPEIEAVASQEDLQRDAVPRISLAPQSTPLQSAAPRQNSLRPISQSTRTPLKNAKQLATRLGGSFALLIAMVFGCSYWGIHRVDEISSSLQEALNKRSGELQVAQEALRYSSENGRLIMEVFLLKTPEAAAPLLARRAENSRKISDLVAVLEKQSDSEKQRQLLRRIQETRTTYVNSYQSALHLLLNDHNSGAAQDVMILQTTPALFAYHAAWNDLVCFEMEQMRTATEQSRARYLSTRHIMFALVFLVGFLVTAIAVFATQQIAKEANTRDRMHQKVNHLNADLERRVEQRTEELARTDNQLRVSLGELQEYTREIEAINELVELLQSCLTLDEARLQATRVLQQFFASGAVLMLNASRNLLDVALRWGPLAGKQGPFAPESCWALRKGKTHLVQPNNLSLVCGHIDETTASCHLCVPMVAQGDSLGVLSIDDPGLCDSDAHPRLLERKQELAKTVAEQISLAFANLMLRETLKYQSVRDPLTGLFNRRHMEESLERELLRAARNSKPVTVLMIDIDHFKRFNDTFGHEAGDILLRELGAIFNSQTRGGDIACRYGGEEFLLIMAETSLEAACERAGKLREHVMNLQVRHHGEMLRRITVSIGVAGFPEHGTSAAQVLKAADEALYQAKADGRDRVVLAATMNMEASVLVR